MPYGVRRAAGSALFSGVSLCSGDLMMEPMDIPAGSGRRLAALYHPPAAADRHRGVLLINPLGQEAVRAHRLLRVLADRLARLGVHVLRFDFHGCGDSSGDDLDGDMKGWQLDVLAAHQGLRQRAGIEAVGWLGIRLGFAVGWQAAARFGGAHDPRLALLTEGMPPDRLIGWDPVVLGQRYLETLWQDHQAALRAAFSLPTVPDRQLRRQKAEASLSEAMGFALSPRLVRHIRALDRQDWQTLPAPHVAVLQANGALPWPAERRSPALHCESVDVDFDWTSEEALNTPLVPDAALRRLLPWLTEDPFHV